MCGVVPTLGDELLGECSPERSNGLAIIIAVGHMVGTRMQSNTAKTSARFELNLDTLLCSWPRPNRKAYPRLASSVCLTGSHVEKFPNTNL